MGMMGGGGDGRLLSHVATAPPPTDPEKPALPVTLPSPSPGPWSPEPPGPKSDVWPLGRPPPRSQAPLSPGGGQALPGSAGDRPSKIQKPWFPAATQRPAGEGEGSRNRRAPSPIPESEERLPWKQTPPCQTNTRRETGTKTRARRGRHTQAEAEGPGTRGQPARRSRQDRAGSCGRPCVLPPRTPETPDSPRRGDAQIAEERKQLRQGGGNTGTDGERKVESPKYSPPTSHHPHLTSSSSSSSSSCPSPTPRPLGPPPSSGSRLRKLLSTTPPGGLVSQSSRRGRGSMAEASAGSGHGGAWGDRSGRWSGGRRGAGRDAGGAQGTRRKSVGGWGGGDEGAQWPGLAPWG